MILPWRMRVLNLDAIVATPSVLDPYRHFKARGVLKDETIAPLQTDFPDIWEQGTVPAEDLDTQGAFSDLLDDLRDPVLAVLVGKKLGLDLTARPLFITVSKWSKATDGRVYTDNTGKLATLLIYLNADWPTDHGQGCLRVLRSDHDLDDYADEIPPVVGNSFGFRRSENSWHGFQPFVGERRMVQATWLMEDRKTAKKRRLDRKPAWLRRFSPFARRPTI
jgi:hypothetical protein